MDSILEQKDLELYKSTDEVLHYLWDPIGISGIPTARDEYYSYIPQVVALLKEGASSEKIAMHLDFIVVNHIGLNSNISHCKKISEILVNWHETITKKYA